MLNSVLQLWRALHLRIAAGRGARLAAAGGHPAHPGAHTHLLSACSSCKCLPCTQHASLWHLASRQLVCCEMPEVLNGEPEGSSPASWLMQCCPRVDAFQRGRSHKQMACQLHRPSQSGLIPVPSTAEGRLPPAQMLFNEFGVDRRVAGAAQAAPQPPPQRPPQRGAKRAAPASPDDRCPIVRQTTGQQRMQSYP